jgi:hypothetical protein
MSYSISELLPYSSEPNQPNSEAQLNITATNKLKLYINFFSMHHLAKKRRAKPNKYIIINKIQLKKYGNKKKGIISLANKKIINA